MTIDKLATPLTITAAVIAIVVYIKSTSAPATPSAVPGMLPNPATVPSASMIPFSVPSTFSPSGNPATPVPPPVQQGTSIIPIIPSSGLTVNNGFGAPTQTQSVVNSILNGGNGSCCGGDEESTGAPPQVGFGYYATVTQNAGM